MRKDAALARKKAAECMARAAKASIAERSAVLTAMARSWMTLANQMDRLEATSVGATVRKPSGWSRRISGVAAGAKRSRR